MNKKMLFAVVVSTLLAIPVAGFASGNVNQEIATATTHAQMATDAADLSTAIMHFHHVINCLVGPKSKLFNAAVGNPCQDMGNGALNDVAKKSATHAKLHQALTIAEQALHAKNIKATQEYSARITKVLKGINLEE